MAPLHSPVERSKTVRRRGSAIILAITTIVMMAILGAAYLQVARIDRRTAASVDTRSNVDDSSILRFIGQILGGDVPASTLSPDIDYHDYPWTQAADLTDQNNSATLPLNARTNDHLIAVEDRFAPTVVPGPVPNLTPPAGSFPDAPAREPRASTPVADAAGRFYSAGSAFDDRWLASTRPDASGIWSHVTNLTGVFLDLDPSTLVADPVTGTGAFPLQYLSTSDPTAPANVREQSGDSMAVPALSTASPAVDEFLFADADGDGIVDSRWTWAPLPSDGGLAYVMAARIIDNSSLLDINHLNYRERDFAAGPPRWMWPGELDLETGIRSVRSRAGLPGPGPTSFGAGTVLTRDAPEGRNLPNAAPVPGAARFRTFNARLRNWLETSAGNTRLPILDDWDSIGSDIEQREAMNPMSTLLAGAATADTILDPKDFDNSLVYHRYGVRQEEIELRWRNGLNRSTRDNSAAEPPTGLEGLDALFFRSGALETSFGDTPFTTEAQFFNQEPRKHITTLSGSANHGQRDINELVAFTDLDDDIDGNTDLDQLANFIDESFATGARPELADPSKWGPGSAFADQMAVTLRDFIDADSLLTVRAGAYGMEYLPFVSEVYLQARYTPGAAVSPGTLNTAGDDLPWTLAANDYSVLVELVNPWPWTIEIPDVELVLNVAGTDTLLGNLFELNSALAPAGSPPPAIPANGTFYLRVEGPSVTGDNVNLAPPGGLPLVDAVGPVSWPTDAGANIQQITAIGDLDLRLDALTSQGNRVTYQVFRTKEIPNVVVEAYNAGTAAGISAGATEGYFQISSLGSADGLDALAVRGDDVEHRGWADDPELASPGSDNLIDAGNALALATSGSASRLGNNLKGATSSDVALADPLDDRVMDARAAATPTTTPINSAEPWIIGNAGRLYRSGDLLRAVILGPRDIDADPEIEPVAEVWRFILNNSTPGSDYRISDLMLDLFSPERVADTGLSHAAYYVTSLSTIETNNRTRGLVAGRPNINTMPADLLGAILPILPPGSGNDIANSIDRARRDPAAEMIERPAGTLGIAYVGQILNGSGAGTLGNPDDVVDFNEYEPEAGLSASPTNSHVEDGFVGDVEEQTIVYNYLNQVVSTRSDVFTAYVLVRAYPADDFTTVSDEFRLLAVFDRSNINANGTPRIVAVKRIQN